MLFYYTNYIKKEHINLDLAPLNTFSIVIPFRNEEKNVRVLINNLSIISYPNSKYEIILVDDCSTDLSFSVLQEIIKSKNLSNFKLLKLVDNEGKKAALTLGISSAKYEYIVTTDADCEFNQNWLYAFDYYLQKDNQLKLIAGGVFFNDKLNYLSVSQSIEMAGLQSVTQFGFKNNKPSMCNGANLCFSKKVFFDVGGYSGFENIASGDDEFLMFKINKMFPYDTTYSNASEILVKTDAISDLSLFIEQRKRWASKIFYRKDMLILVQSVFLYLFHLAFIVLLFSLVLQFNYLILSIVIFKFLAEYVFLNKSFKLYSEKKIFIYILSLQFVYSFYVIFVGISLVKKSYIWKSRKVI
jgi:poly-beta-1,6-N-acetyl-D-glucosamine synthase